MTPAAIPTRFDIDPFGRSFLEFFFLDCCCLLQVCSPTTEEHIGFFFSDTTTRRKDNRLVTWRSGPLLKISGSFCLSVALSPLRPSNFVVLFPFTTADAPAEIRLPGRKKFRLASDPDKTGLFPAHGSAQTLRSSQD